MGIVGQKIKELRLERELTQRELALIFNINHSTLAMWETNKNQPDIETLIRLANYFNVSVDYIIGNTDIWGNEISTQTKSPPNISEDEREILKLYDNLSPERKREAIVWLKTLKDLDKQTLQRLKNDDKLG